jgi:hypothetical protein
MSWIEHFALGGILVFAAIVSFLATSNIGHDPKNEPVMVNGTRMYDFDRLHQTYGQACLADCEMMVVHRAHTGAAQTVMAADLAKTDFQVK